MGFATFKLWSEPSNIEFAASICPALINEWYLRNVRSGHVTHQQPAKTSIASSLAANIDITSHRIHVSRVPLDRGGRDQEDRMLFNTFEPFSGAHSHENSRHRFG